MQRNIFDRTNEFHTLVQQYLPNELVNRKYYVNKKYRWNTIWQLERRNYESIYQHRELS